MVRMISQLRRAPVLLLLSVALASSGCLFSPEEDDPGDDARLTVRNSIDNTIKYLSEVWGRKLIREYEDVLHDQYEFFPRDTDVDDFPWLEGDSWGRTQEVDIARNMFNSDYSGTEPPVDRITIELTKLSQRLLNADEQRWEVTCRQNGTVLKNATDGWSFDTLVLIELVPDPDQPGLWQMIKQTEEELIG